jgi:hypothetical protein
MSYAQSKNSVTEVQLVLAAEAADQFTVGATPWVSTDTMLLTVEVENFAGGEVNIVVQTADEDVTTDAEWVDTYTRINGIVADGTYTIELNDPIMFQVRAKVEIVSDFTGDITVRWGSNPLLIALS